MSSALALYTDMAHALRHGPRSIARAAIQRFTLYSYTAIQRYTLYNLYNTPLA